MPKFDQQLSDINPKSFISPGVSDTAASDLMKNAVSTGMSTYSAIQTTDMWKNMQGEIEGYLKQKGEAAGREQQFNRDMGDLVTSEDALWENAGSIPEKTYGARTDWEEVNAVQQRMTQTLEKYVSAQKQGRMSPEELHTRLLSEVRKAASNNPLIQDELIQQGQKYLAITGAADWIKQELKDEEKVAKQEEALYEQDKKFATEFGISMSLPNWRQRSREQAVIAQNHKLVTNQIDERLKRKTMAREELAELVNNPANRQVFLLGALANVHSSFQHASVFPNAKASDVVLATNQEINRQIAFINSVKANLPSDQRVSLDGEIKLLEDQRSLYKDLAELGPNKAVAEARLAIAQAGARLPNVSAHELADLNSKVAGFLRTIAGETGQLIPSGNVMQFVDPDLVANMVKELNNAKNRFDTQPALALANLQTPTGRVAVQIMSNLQNPKENQQAIKLNSESMKQMITHLGTLTDETQATQATDIYLQQMLDSSKAAGLSIGQMVDQSTMSALNEHIGTLMGRLRSGEGTVDYDPNTNRFSYLNKDGTINQTASDRANQVFKALISVNGFKDEDTIDKWGSLIGQKVVGTTTQEVETPDPRLTRLQTLADEYNNALADGDMETANLFKLQMNKLEKEFGAQKPSETEEEKAIKSGEIPSLTDEQRQTLNKEPEKVKPLDRELVEGLKGNRVKPIVDVRQESTQKLLKRVEELLPKNQKSPLWEKDPKLDAIQSSGISDALIEVAERAHPAVGIAVATGMVAFGPAGIASLAKHAPKLLPKAGKVAEGLVGSNITGAAANPGASKALVSSMLATASKNNKAKVEALYKEFWTKEWIKNKVAMPKTDLEWSKAIGQANSWVAEKLAPTMIKTMEK